MTASRRGLLSALTLRACWIFGSSWTSGRELSYEERVRAQQAIEHVRYSHQIGATRPFEEAVPQAALERLVRTTLRRSAALERFWGRPIRGEDLDRETDRIF